MNLGIGHINIRRPSILTGASLSITVHQPQDIAPAGVFFSASVSGIGGALANHDLDIYWTFGETVSSPATIARVNSIWTDDLSDAHGPTACHTYASPGTFTVTCVVTDGTTILSETVDITIRDPDVVYAGDKTWAVDAGSDFTWAPAGCTQYTSLDAALIAKDTERDPCRIIIKPASSHALTGIYDINNWWSRNNFRVQVYGAGRATIDVSAISGTVFTRGNCLDVQFVGIDFVGGWDSTTETGQSQTLFTVLYDGAHWTMYDCTFTGLSATFNYQPNAWTDLSMTICGCEMDGWQDYGALFGVSLYAGLVGNRIEQDPNAMGGGPKDGTHNTHGPVRFTTPQPGGFHVLDKNQFFSNNGWSTAGAWQAHQACCRWNVMGVEGARMNAQRNVFEGGWVLFDSYGNAGAAEDRPQEMLLDRNLFLGTSNTQAAIYLGHSGSSVRSNVIIFPNAKLGMYRGPDYAIRWNATNSNAANDAGYFGIIGNTLVDLRDDTNSGGTASQVMETPTNFTNVTEINNLVHIPNSVLNVDVSNDPLDDATLFEPYYAGYLDYLNTPIDTSYASPAGFPATFQPFDSSAALAAASGKVTLRDLLGTVRPASPAIGATETAGAQGVAYDPITNSPDWYALGSTPVAAITAAGEISIGSNKFPERAGAYKTDTPTDVAVSATFLVKESGTDCASFPLAARIVDYNNFIGVRPSGGVLQVYQRSAGNFGTMLGSAAYPAGATYPVTLTVEGANVTLTVDGTDYGPWTTTVTAAGRVGFVGRDNKTGTTALIKDFAFTSLD